MFTLKLNENSLKNALEQVVEEGMRTIKTNMTEDICSLSCPEHGKHPSPVADPEHPNSLKFDMCCDKLKELVEQKIAKYQESTEN